MELLDARLMLRPDPDCHHSEFLDDGLRVDLKINSHSSLAHARCKELEDYRIQIRTFLFVVRGVCARGEVPTTLFALVAGDEATVSFPVEGAFSDNKFESRIMVIPGS